MARYRCRACGNRTRFDVVATRKTKVFLHFDLGGQATIEEEEEMFNDVESVTCRWCGASNAIEEVSEDDVETAATGAAGGVAAASS